MNQFALGPFHLDGDALTLGLEGVPMALGPKVVETLLALVERAGGTVSHAEVAARVWPGDDVDHASVVQNVYVLRKALRAHWDVPAIETVPRSGYRFVAPVRRLTETPARQPRRSALGWSGIVAAAAVLLSLTLMPTVRAHGGAEARLSTRGAELYAIGRYHLNLRTRDGLLRSAAYFTELERADPRSPLGYAGLAAAYALMPQYGVRRPSQAVTRARAWSSAREALARDPASAQAHAVVGLLQSLTSMRPGAGSTELARAVRLDPSEPEAHLWYGAVLYGEGRIATARAEFETAEGLAPAAPAIESWLADALFMARDYDGAAEHLHRALDLDPGRVDAWAQLGTVEVQRGAYGRAFAAFARYARHCEGCGSEEASLRAYAFAHMREPDAARAALRTALRALSVAPHAGKDGVLVQIAFVFVALGDRARALDALRTAQHAWPAEGLVVAAEPRLDPVREDPRFRSWTRPAST
jgi:DNA-binding winged helix-turn-helix (wHTH) protein/Flp pilus assembly protein TadD